MEIFLPSAALSENRDLALQKRECQIQLSGLLGCCSSPVSSKAGREAEQDPTRRDIRALFSLTAAVHSGKCMFNSFTIYGVMRTMSVSEEIIASRRGAGEFKLVGTWTLNRGWRRLALPPHNSAGDKAAGDGEGAGSHPRASRAPTRTPLVPVLGTRQKPQNWPFPNLHLQASVHPAARTKPCPLETAGSFLFPSFPLKTSSLLGPGCLCPNLLLLGRGGRGLTLGSVLSSHMELQSPQRSRASIWRARHHHVSQLSPWQLHLRPRHSSHGARRPLQGALRLIPRSLEAALRSPGACSKQGALEAVPKEPWRPLCGCRSEEL